ncbi:hypothetical protein ACHHYP_15474 [Achlya hypogyna]|uniref:Ankyrin repeat protein n=1 Tax=Achlya hypogyna TaxID=1202772 RepID=A0A1V9YAU9_ACHHY|nr:hypothetical protein ACHHYP_15474 [Achlya hypogyna]
MAPRAAISVLSSTDLVSAITAYMPGKAYRNWTEVYAIMAAGHRFMLKDKHELVATEADVESAVFDNRLDLVDELLASYDFQFDTSSLVKVAASEGHVEVLNYLLQRRRPHYDGVCDGLVYGAAGGHLTVTEELGPRVSPRTLQKAIAYAADFGHDDVVASLETALAKWHDDVCTRTRFQQPHITTGTHRNASTPLDMSYF